MPCSHWLSLLVCISKTTIVGINFWPRMLRHLALSQGCMWTKWQETSQKREANSWWTTFWYWWVLLNLALFPIYSPRNGTCKWNWQAYPHNHLNLPVQCQLHFPTFLPMAIDTLVQDAIVVHRKSPTTSQRKLGETETSYYLPSRESGVNDMYVYLVKFSFELLKRLQVSSPWLQGIYWAVNPW